MKQNSDTSVKSATRAIDILEFVAAAESPPTFGDVALALNIPNSSLFYLLNTLAQRGYLIQEGERGGYKLGGAVEALASRGNRAHSWRQLAIPLLDQLTTALNETSTYAEQRGDEVECIATKLATQMLMPVLRAGQRAPLYVFSGGKVLLANMSDDAIEAYINRSRFERLTPRTISNGKNLWREIREIRSTGIAYSRDEHTLGVTGISVALRAANQVVGTLGVALASVRFTKESDALICRQLARAANRFALETERPSSRLETPMRRARSADYRGAK